MSGWTVEVSLTDPAAAPPEGVWSDVGFGVIGAGLDLVHFDTAGNGVRLAFNVPLYDVPSLVDDVVAVALRVLERSVSHGAEERLSVTVKATRDSAP